jgi:tetratricopeptide (TPR) repeat protein
MTQNFEQKFKILQNRITFEKDSYEDFYKLGQLYLRKKIYSNAIDVFRQALKCWDWNDQIGLGSLYNTIGFMYYTLKEYDYAIYYYKQALYLIPDYTLALTNLAVTYEKLKLFETSYHVYKKVLQYDANNKIANSRIPYLKNKFQFLE